MSNVKALWFALAAALNGAAAAQQPPWPLVAYEAPVVPDLVTDGTAIVVFTVRANGRVADAVTIAATERSLANAAREAVMRWRFQRDPALGRGRDAEPGAVVRREIIEFVFKRDGTVSSRSHAESAKAWFPSDRGLAVRTVLPDELDRPLVRLATPASPATEALVSALTVAGRATVSFVIDETGKVRVPFVLVADDPALVAPALAVVADWRFEPATDDGDRVLVDERNMLTFRAQRQ